MSLEALLNDCEDNNWKTRLDSATTVAQLIGDNSARFLKGKYSQRAIDIYVKLFNDNNAKVQLQAITVFEQLTQCIPDLVETNATIIMQSTYNALASNRVEVKHQAETMLQTFSMNLDCLVLLQSFCRGAEYGLTKARPFFIGLLKRTIYK